MTLRLMRNYRVVEGLDVVYLSRLVHAERANMIRGIVVVISLLFPDCRHTATGVIDYIFSVPRSQSLCDKPARAPPTKNKLHKCTGKKAFSYTVRGAAS